MQILRVNMDQRSTSREDLDDHCRDWAGRGLIARVLLREVEPTCAALGPRNKLIIANGFLAGTRVSSSGRISVGAKSPLTGGIKEANAGGVAGDALARLGLRSIVVEGSPKEDALYLLKIGKDSAEFLSAEEFRGLGTYALCDKLYERYGKKIAVICIGPAGEHRMAAAGVAVNDADGYPSRYAGRGGLGAVMGAKGLKAIVLEDVRAEVPIANKEAFREAQKRLNAALLENPSTGKEFPEYGTISMLNKIHKLGGIPTKNFSQGTFDEHYPKLSAEGVRQTIVERGGEGTPTHGCMQGCVIRCSNVFPDARGKAIVSPLEYENLVMLGPNLGIFSLDQIAKLNYMCNDYGTDTIETGVSIGVAMEAGIIPFGDFEGAAKLMNGIAEGTVLGRVIGQGAATAGRVLGVKRVPVMKGQGVAAYDPRAVKGIGVSYVTSPMGADHTAGHTVYAKIDHHLPEGQIQTSLASQILRAAYDTVCICGFAIAAIGGNPTLITDLMNATHGTKLEPTSIQEMGKQVLRMERTFNKSAGFTKAHDTCPEFFRTEKLPPYDLTFDVPQEDIDHFFDPIEN